MLPGPFDLELYQGDYWDHEFDLKTNTGTIQDPVLVAKDLTNCTIEATIKKKPTSEVLATFVGTVVGDPQEGRIFVQLPALEAAKLAISTGVWDLQVVQAVAEEASRPRTWIAGVVTVFRQVTP